MSQLRFPQHLDVVAWEKALGGASAPFSAGGRPDEALAAEGLHLDFTRVEWVDFSVLARSLLLLDAVAQLGIQVTVTMPAPELTLLELAAIDRASASGADDMAPLERQMRHRASQRGQVVAFMEQAGFVKALDTAPWRASLTVVRAAAADSGENPADEPSVKGGTAGTVRPQTPSAVRRRRLMPLQWLRLLEGQRPRDSESFSALETGLHDLGLAASDAKAISQTLIAELVEHALFTGAGDHVNVLIGAALLEPSSFAAQKPRLAGRGDGLFDAVEDDEARVLRLVVGDGWTDSGNPAELLTSGLRRVARVAHNYRGSVTARADTHSARLRLSDGIQGIDALEDLVGWTPGFVYEAAVLTDPQFPRSTAPRRTVQVGVSRGHALRWIACTIDPNIGITDDDYVGIQAEIERERDNPDEVGVVVTVSTSPDGPRSAGLQRAALQKTLEVLSLAARHTAVAVVLPDASPALIDLQVTEMRDRFPFDGAQAEESGPRRALLVFGSHGSPLWYGKSSPFLDVLNALTDSDAPMPLEGAEHIWLAAGGDITTFASAMHEEEHLFSVQDGLLVLRLSPLLVLESLKRAAHQALVSEVAGAGEGVEEGLFRTPTLHITNRWIDVARLLEGTIGTDFAAFMLARGAETELASQNPLKPLAVAQASPCPPGLTAKVSECLALHGTFFPMASELDQDGWSASGEVPDDACVVLCADVISTENTVRRAAAAIARHAALAVIVCVLDARADRGPIRVLNREIPVVSLAEIGVATVAHPSDTRVVDIDPVLRRPALPRVPEAQVMDEGTLFDLCAPQAGTQSGALRLGHFKRLRRTHFSANIQLDRLFRRTDAREQVAEVMARTVRESLDSLARPGVSADVGDSIDLWYPGVITENSGVLAWAVWQCLSGYGLPVASPTAINRVVAGTFSQTILPDPSVKPKRVVIIDYAMRTGATVTQLIHAAAQSGATGIVAVVLLNQLPYHEPGLHGMVSAVRARVDGSPAAEHASTVVRFITNTSIGALDALDCPICATRQKYADLGKAPKRLISHAKALQELLMPRYWREIYETAAGDLFNVPVTHDETVDYIRWRGLLHKALRDTGARQSVLDRLAGVVESSPRREWTQRALIRLLAAEQQWLKLPPLRFAAARILLAAICLDELGTSAPEPPWLRAQAIMVLSITAPEQFVSELRSLLGSIADEPRVADQALLECYRLVRRPSHDSPVDHGELRKSLIECRDYLESSQAGWDQELIEELLYVVRQLISLAELSRRPRNDSPQTAWAELREYWNRPVKRHHFEQRVIRVRDFLEDLGTTRPDDDLLRANDTDWDACARQVQERALPWLPALREILTGEYVGEVLGPEDRDRLVELTRTDTSGLFLMTEDLHTLTRSPWTPEADEWRSTRDDALDRINWWHRMFFATHRIGTESPAFLVELVESAPTVLAEAIDAAVASVGLDAVATRSGSFDDLVFCPKPLIVETVEHILRNANRHRRDATVQEFQISVDWRTIDALRFSIANTGSRPTRQPGRGLDELDRSLRPFGGSLSAVALSDGPWTFKVSVSLQIWRGA